MFGWIARFMADKIGTDRQALLSEIVAQRDTISALVRRCEAHLNKEAERPCIIDIRREGRNLVINFIRNGKVSTITAYADMSLDVAELRREAGL